MKQRKIIRGQEFVMVMLIAECYSYLSLFFFLHKQVFRKKIEGAERGVLSGGLICGGDP